MGRAVGSEFTAGGPLEAAIGGCGDPDRVAAMLRLRDLDRRLGSYAEELDRLVSHVDQARKMLAEGGPVGRRLDFLSQELNRESNTLGSKSASLDMTQTSVELKVLIEQMREQVQNLE